MRQGATPTCTARPNASNPNHRAGQTLRNLRPVRRHSAELGRVQPRPRLDDPRRQLPHRRESRSSRLTSPVPTPRRRRRICRPDPHLRIRPACHPRRVRPRSDPLRAGQDRRRHQPNRRCLRRPETPPLTLSRTTAWSASSGPRRRRGRSTGERIAAQSDAFAWRSLPTTSTTCTNRIWISSCGLRRVRSRASSVSWRHSSSCRMPCPLP